MTRVLPGTVERRQLAAADLLNTVLSSLDDSKAEDIVSIDITGKSPLADYMVVASGRSQRHVAAIAERLAKDIEEAGGRVGNVEGLPHADWVLIDTADVIIHIFRPEVRSFYNLEKMWQADLPRPMAARPQPVTPAS
ncbi:ribosome silencing factor [Prosthecomicrobium pneumaticum]|uniref:Ribosomal silencing factor RsfS n=1 Tax=Prosthecomicrobium pneumaticum TaxID=81895 RepID=A0A7W9FML5_9HYPH|nr:ribosome-associated protein [Prosthecomicrobium pneumaticum]